MTKLIRRFQSGGASDYLKLRRLEFEESLKTEAELYKKHNEMHDTALNRKELSTTNNTNSVSSSLDEASRILELIDPTEMFKGLGQAYKDAADSQLELKIEKANQYKNMARSLITAAELGLSGTSLLRAYGNWRKWQNSISPVKKAIVNILNKRQIPLQGTGTAIDAAQTYDAVKRGDTFDTAWNTTEALLGLAGTLGATDVFRNSRLYHPNIDFILDTSGVIQNSADILKAGYDTMSPFFNKNNKK